MDSRIQVLPDHVANQIAAGEVVERPSSVVKELVENSLDAGSTRVRVEVEDGGKRLIRVIDNGCGMSPTDALGCLGRHATSKITDVNDLNAIGTLGFRGEALPSIRSVSRFQIKTRQHNSAEGVRVIADGADEPTMEPVGCPVGTEILVRDLFFNVPVRRKFLRRAGTEMSRIGDLIDQFALGWPGVHFTLTHNGRRSSDYPSDRNLQARVLAVLGRDVVRQMHAVRLTMGSAEIMGFTSEPALSRPNNRGVYTFVNGRFVRDRVVRHAVVQAYDQLLDRGRFPVTVLCISVSPDAVDVNVHPAKSEVRFVDSGGVHSLVERSLRLTLSDTPWVRFSEDQSGSHQVPHNSDLFAPDNSALVANPSMEAPPEIGVVTSQEPPFGLDRENTSPSDNQTTRPLEFPHPDNDGFFKSLKYIGQAHDSFLVCQSADSIHFIDQHKADHYIALEKLKKLSSCGDIGSQRLMFPARLSLDETTAELAQLYSKQLVKLGYVVEPFGGNDWVVTEVPQLLASVEVGPVVIELLNVLSSSESALQSSQAALVTMARHAATQPGQELSIEQARMILNGMDGTPLSATSAHRELVVVTYPFSEVSRWFRRT